MDLLWFNTHFYMFGYGTRDPRFGMLRVEFLKTDRAHVELPSGRCGSRKDKGGYSDWGCSESVRIGKSRKNTV